MTTTMTETETAEVRHLAAGSTDHALCGVDRSTVSTIHPSKARKTDCAKCREAWRVLKAKKPLDTTTGPKFVELSKDTTKPTPIFCERCGSDTNVVDWADAKLCAKCVDIEKSVAVTAAAVRDSELDTSLGESVIDRLLETPADTSILGIGVAPDEPSESAKALEPPKPYAEMTKQEFEDEVIRLRLLGLAHIPIEKRMGMKPQHGNRPWRICKKRGVK